MNDILAWIGGGMLALCALPQAISCIKTGHSRGLDWSFLLLWFFGELLMILYTFERKDIPLLTNYIVNLVFVIIMLRYKIRERK